MKWVQHLSFGQGIMNMSSFLRRLIPLIAGALSICPARASLTQYRAAVTNEASLISYYTFDASSAADAKGLHDGTAAGTVSYATGVGGGADKALILKGTGHVNLGAVPEFDFASGIGSVEGWIRTDWTSNPGFNPAVFTAREGGQVSWSIHMNGSKNAAGLWNGSTYETLGIPAPSTNWHHIAVVFDIDSQTGTGVFSLFWDGNLVGTTQQNIGSSPDVPTEIGSSAEGGAERWIGGFDEVAFYSTALSADTVKAHYTAFLVGDPPTIQVQPVGGTFLANVPLNLSVTAKGAQLTYQWFKNDVALPGQTNATLAFTQLAAGDAGPYRVTVTNPGGHVESSIVQVALGTLPSRLQEYQTAVRAESSLISYYTFDQLGANDSKSSNNGTVHGSVQFGDGIAGAAGKALVLNGSGHINLGQVSAFDFPSGNGTVEAWIRPDWSSLGYNPAILTDRDGGSVNWSVHMNDAKNAAGVWNGATYDPQPTPGAGNAWHHLAVVFALDSGSGETSVTTYWDGQPAGSSTQGLGPSPESPTELGSSSTGGAELWVGALDEVAFYSDALSAAAIQAHYSKLIAGSAPVITSQPVGGAHFVGNPATLTVGAQGLDLTYQWFKNGTAITDANLATLNIPALAAGDTGTYRVRVSNSAGSQESVEVKLDVVVPNLSAYQTAVRAESSLISYYTFDSSDASDSKDGNQGAVAGTVNFGAGVGAGTDHAAVMDSSGHIDLGPVSAFNFTSGLGTVEAWIRSDWTTSPGYNPAIIANRDGGSVIWSVHMNSGKDGLGLWNGSTYQPLPLPNPGADWHHLAFVFDHDNSLNTALFTVYWDGTELGHTQQGLGPATDTPTELGSSVPADGAERWIGALDEVAFYSTALSASAIRGHYQALVGESQATSPSLNVVRSGQQITVSWVESGTPFVLQFSPSLSAPAWTTAPGVVNRSLTVNTSTGNGFYRLAQQ